jgi:hypothetical protein
MEFFYPVFSRRAVAAEPNVLNNPGMTTNPSQPAGNRWQIDSNRAQLWTPQLTGVVDLQNPSRGLSQLLYQGQPVAGSLLGVLPSDATLFTDGEMCDQFVRGDDLVVTYRETRAQPFSLQIYWRATTDHRGALVLDLILSLQTDLLESFPALTVQTELSADTVECLPSLETLTVTAEQPLELPAERGEGLLLRQNGAAWSYAETTHPEDREASRLVQANRLTLQRPLGGRFLEKGVIRCLRVRGVLLPRAQDVELATHHLEALAHAQPPLTV